MYIVVICTHKIEEQFIVYHIIYYYIVASQMWTLGRLLPVMIGHIIPEDNPHWLHYLEVLDIMDLCFSPFVRPETPGYLEVLIEQNLQAFQDLYPDSSILPKMHFLVHMPHFLARFALCNLLHSYML